MQDSTLPELTIVIPHRHYENADYTLESLKLSSYQDFKTVVVSDEGKGAGFARNKGFLQVDTEFVLFSDNDIQWTINGIKHMMDCLKEHPECSYCYGTYRLGEFVWCSEQFDADLLRYQPYISTMSVIRTKDFPGFDEKIRRFQDWDLWLTMLEQGKIGINCNKLIFETPVKPGITQDPEYSQAQACKVIREKHKLEKTFI